MGSTLDFSFVARYWPQLLDGTIVTLELSLLSIVLGVVVGTVSAVGSVSRFRLPRVVAGCYVEVIRNTPLLIQLFIVYFGLASLGVRLPALVCAVIGLTANVGAYSSEIIRAGIESVRRGQLEAAECLGLSRWQTLRDVVLPVAFERVYPALTSQFVLLMLSTSVTSQISAEDLTAEASRIQSETFRSFEVFLLIAGIYVLSSLVMRGGLRLLGRYPFPRRHRLGTPL